MSFKLVVDTPFGDPEVVYELDDVRVRRVMFGSRSGGAGEVRIDPDQTEVVISFELAQRDTAPNFEELDLITHPRNLTDDDAEERRQAIVDSGGLETNVGRDNFTPEAVEERQRLEEEAGLGTPEHVAQAQRSADDRQPAGSSSVRDNEPLPEVKEKKEKELAKAPAKS